MLNVNSFILVSVLALGAPETGPRPDAIPRVLGQRRSQTVGMTGIGDGSVCLDSLVLPASCAATV